MLNEENEGKSEEGICGKITFTQSRFVYVPATHTASFRDKFKTLYAPHYPNVPKNASKFGLDKDKPDPLNLIAQKRTRLIGRGCWVIWNPELLHGQVKTPLEAPIEFGCYLGFFPAGSRPKYEKKCGVNELDDRVESYIKGIAPKLWPSLDRIHYTPAKFVNFPTKMLEAIKKTTPGHASIGARTDLKGNKVPTLNPLPLPNYVPTFLSPLGVCVCACALLVDLSHIREHCGGVVT